MFRFFAVNTEVNGQDWRAWMVLIFALTSSIFTSLVALPQLVHLVKTKKTNKNTWWVSYWVFFFALMAWIIVGSFDANYKYKMSASSWANIVCGYIFGLVLFFMYKYDDNKRRKKNKWFVLGFTMGLTTILASLACVGLYANNGEYHLPENAMAILMILVPMLTSLAFLPQIIKNFEIKNFSSLSTALVLAFIATNVSWIFYWAALMIQTGITNTLLTALTWQILSIILYTGQLAMMIREKKQIKLRNKQNKNDGKSQENCEQTQKNKDIVNDNSSELENKTQDNETNLELEEKQNVS